MKVKKQTILAGSILLLLADLIMKYVIKTYLTKTITIIPNFFYLTYTENEGAAWGIFQGKTYLLIGISILCFIVLLREVITKQNSKITSISYMFILGGLVGNLFDRIFYGYVTDYLQFTFGNYSFPIFNLADIVIVVGIFLLLIEIIRGEIDEI